MGIYIQHIECLQFTNVYRVPTVMENLEKSEIPKVLGKSCKFVIFICSFTQFDLKNKHFYTYFFFYYCLIHLCHLRCINYSCIVYTEISQHFWSCKFGLTSWTSIGRHVCDPVYNIQ